MGQGDPQICRYRILNFVWVLSDWILFCAEGSILDSLYGIMGSDINNASTYRGVAAYVTEVQLYEGVLISP